MAHLFGLGLYQDVQVDASLAPNGVVLVYTLVPAHRVRRIVFEGATSISESELRRIVVERHGVSPSLARASQAVTTLKTLYRDRGYPRAEIEVRADIARDPANAAMVFTVRPGPTRADRRDRRSGIAARAGAAASQLSQHARRRRVRRHRAGSDGCCAMSEDLRGQGYYEARASQLPRYVDDDAAVNLVLSVDAGPLVEIRFQGDALREEEREQLVPIAREHSVDEDLLEDSKFGIERYFRERGYCIPRADYQRTEAGPKPAESAALRVTFTIARGPTVCRGAGRADGQHVDLLERSGSSRPDASGTAVQ